MTAQRGGAEPELGGQIAEAYAYDSRHRPLTVTDAANKTTTLTYNARGQLLTATNALSQTTTLAYDSDGYLSSVTGPMTGATYAFTYDDHGLVHTTTTPEAYVVTRLYDAADRPTSVSFPDGTSERFVYDRLDLVRTKDRAGRWSVASYDAVRRPVAFRDALGRVTRQTWCACGSLESLTDANGNTTSWERDARGRTTKEIRANAAVTELTYETATSRVKSVKDPKLQVTTYSYAKDDAVLGVVYTNETTATPDVTFTYDAAYRRLATMTDGVGTTAYAYVPVGTPGAGREATVDGPLATATISYTYDALGRTQTRLLNGVTTTWTYDTLGRLQSEADSMIGTFTFAYHGVSGRLQQLTYPNAQKSVYQYFGTAGDLRLQDIHHQTGGGTTLSRFSYAYDTVGNIATWTQQYGADVKAYDFTYDALDQLTSATYRTTGATPTIVKRYGYAYDPVGNRTTARTDDTPLLYGYNNMNRLTSQGGGGVVAFSGTTGEPASVTVAGTRAEGAGTDAFSGRAVLASGTNTVAITATDASGNTTTQSYEVDVPASTGTFTYDANGNLTAQGTKTYTWDAENRLTRVLDGATELARFVYDGAGRRVQKIAGGVTRSYVYDGMDILQERGPSGTTRTVHGPGIDQPLASVDPVGGVSYYLADHLGSIVQQTNASATVTLTRQYDPYGVPTQGGATSGYAFTGREWDAEIDLYYFRARYYDPKLATFISEDPLGFSAGTNFYTYVSNNPSRFRDPLGLLVTAVYNNTTGTLTVTDRDTGESITIAVESGGKPWGDPIPNGVYEILEQAARPDFFRLDRVDWKPRNDIDDVTGRDRFRLHKPGRTVGCIAAKTEAEWTAVEDLILKTKTVTVTENYEDPWWNVKSLVKAKKSGGATITKYGDLVVTSDVRRPASKGK